MNLTDSFRNRVAAGLLGGTAIPLAPTYWLSLHTGTPNSGNELTAAGYARVAITNDGSHFAATGNVGERANVSAVTFPQAGENWPAATYFALHEHATDFAHVVGGAALSPSLTVSNGDVGEFAAGALKLAVS